ncbi:MAG TPA: O-antigen ligase family protein [Myxococcota bacterium]|nr:O-antigen ligase family protein [Myxococcota bacterium]
MSATPAEAAGPAAQARRPARAAARRGAPTTERPTQTVLLWALIVFFWLEYARPAGIVNLRLQFVISSLIPLFWIAGRGRPWSPILTAQLVFLLVNAAMVPFVLNTFAAYMTTRAMYGNFAIALGLSWLLSRRDWFTRVAWVWLGVMAYCALFGLTHGGFGPGGFLRDENDLALGCSTALAFCLFGFVALTGWERWASGALGLLFVMTSVATLSRGGFIALVGVGVYFFIGSRHKARDLGLVMLASAVFLIFAPPQYVKELKSIEQTNEGTAEKRQFLWATATNMWKAYPLFGVGGNNFPYHAGDYQPMEGDWPEDYYQRSSSGTTVHSMFFQLLSEQGLVGVGLVGTMLFVHFRTLRRVRRLVASRKDAPASLRRHVECYGGALGGAVVGAVAAGGFISTLYYPYIWYFTSMTVALEAGARRELASLRALPASAGPAPERPGRASPATP